MIASKETMELSLLLMDETINKLHAGAEHEYRTLDAALRNAHMRRRVIEENLITHYPEKKV